MLQLYYDKLNYINIFKFFLYTWVLSIPFKNSVYQISTALIVLFFLFHVIRKKNTYILIENWKETVLLSIGFFAVIFSMILSNILNPEMLDNKSWHNIYMFFIRYGLVFIALAYFYKQNFFTKKELIILVFISLSFLMLTGVYQTIQNPNLFYSAGITGTLDNRNGFGLFMGMGFVLSLILIKEKANLGFLLLLLFCFFMIFSFSRSSWVACFCSSFLLLILNYKNIKKIHILYFLVFCIGIGLLFTSFDSFNNRFIQLLEGKSTNRTTIWLHTLNFIKESLFYGYGIDSWKNLPDKLLNRFPDPHNLFLEILIYTGLIGLVSCLFSIIVILIKIIKTKQLILLPIATYFLIVTQFDFGAYGSKELLSFLTIFVFVVYSNNFNSKISI